MILITVMMLTACNNDKNASQDQNTESEEASLEDTNDDIKNKYRLLLVSHLIQTIFYGLFKERPGKVVFFVQLPELEIIFNEGIDLDTFRIVQTVGVKFGFNFSFLRLTQTLHIRKRSVV